MKFLKVFKILLWAAKEIATNAFISMLPKKKDIPSLILELLLILLFLAGLLAWWFCIPFFFLKDKGGADSFNTFGILIAVNGGLSLLLHFLGSDTVVRRLSKEFRGYDRDMADDVRMIGLFFLLPSCVVAFVLTCWNAVAVPVTEFLRSLM